MRCGRRFRARRKVRSVDDERHLMHPDLWTLSEEIGRLQAVNKALTQMHEDAIRKLGYADQQQATIRTLEAQVDKLRERLRQISDLTAAFAPQEEDDDG